MIIRNAAHGARVLQFMLDNRRSFWKNYEIHSTALDMIMDVAKVLLDRWHLTNKEQANHISEDDPEKKYWMGRVVAANVAVIEAADSYAARMEQLDMEVPE